MTTDSDVDTDGGGPPPGEAETSVDGDPVLRATDVHKSYGEVTALSGADLSVGRGEVFGLIGPNGAGKTTLVRALTGTTAVEGTVRVLGATPSAVDPERIGLLPQSFDPPERLTARELVSYYAGLYTNARDIDAVISDVGLAADADTWYETLSGGQQRRACVATALVNDPDVLFLDEPTTGIDPAGRRDIHQVIREAAAAGTTVFLTSHSMGEVEQLADRVGLLRDGSIVAVGSPAALIADYGGSPTLTVTLEEAETQRSTAEAATRNDVADSIVETAVDAIRSTTSFDVRQDTTNRAVGGDSGAAGAGGTRTTTIEVTNVPLAGIDDVLDALTGTGVAVESVSWSEPSLEDVYLELTGEAYRPSGPIDGPDTATDSSGGHPSRSGAVRNGGSR